MSGKIYELQKKLIERVYLLNELSEIYSKIDDVHRNTKQAETELANKLAEEKKLSETNLKNKCLSILGLMEGKSETLQREIYAIRTTVNHFTGEYDFMNERMQEIELLLSNSASEDIEFLKYVSERYSEEDHAKLEELLVATKRYPMVCYAINSQLVEFQDRLNEELKIYTYGDLRTELSGRTYDAKYNTMKSMCLDMKNFLAEFIDLLEEYNAYVSESHRIDLKEEWIQNQNYWDNYQLPEDIHNRFKVIDNWHYSFTWNWKRQKTDRKAIEESLRNQLIEVLNSI